jgi:hypothetical protein
LVKCALITSSSMMYGLAEGLLEGTDRFQPAEESLTVTPSPIYHLWIRPLHQRFKPNRFGPLSSTAKITLVDLLLFLGITTVLDFAQRHTRYVPGSPRLYHCVAMFCPAEG